MKISMYKSIKLFPFIVNSNIQSFLSSCAFRANRQDAVLGLHAGACYGRVGREGIIVASALCRAAYLYICIRGCIIAQYALSALPVAFRHVGILQHLRNF